MRQFEIFLNSFFPHEQILFDLVTSRVKILHDFVENKNNTKKRDKNAFLKIFLLSHGF